MAKCLAKVTPLAGEGRFRVLFGSSPMWSLTVVWSGVKWFKFCALLVVCIVSASVTIKAISLMKLSFCCFSFVAVCRVRNQWKHSTSCSVYSLRGRRRHLLRAHPVRYGSGTCRVPGRSAKTFSHPCPRSLCDAKIWYVPFIVVALCEHCYWQQGSPFAWYHVTVICENKGVTVNLTKNYNFPCCETIASMAAQNTFDKFLRPNDFRKWRK